VEGKGEHEVLMVLRMFIERAEVNLIPAISFISYLIISERAGRRVIVHQARTI
jgi:hypothetical protein